MRRALFIGVVALGLACGPQAPIVEGTPKKPSAPEGSSRIVLGPPRAADGAPIVLDDLPARPSDSDLAGTPRATLVTVTVNRVLTVDKPAGVAARPRECDAWAKRSPSKIEGTLMHALAQSDPAIRDAMLVTQADLPSYTRAALRASFAPIECADAITDPEIGDAEQLFGAAVDVLVGFSIGAKLSRSTDARAVEALRAALTGLSGYAAGIALLEAGLADFRLARPERKALARDSILTAFSGLASAGILRSERVDKARRVLSREYPTLRIDALDDLLLPKWTPQPAYSDGDRAYTNTPPYWLPATQSCRGFVCEDYARRRIELGRLYWRRVDFLEAAHAARIRATHGDPTVAFYYALTRDLLRGPNDASDRMARRGTAIGFNETPALDAFAKEPWWTAGLAAYDAAVLRSLAIPEDETADAYRRDVAQRFEESAALLADDASKKKALERARAMTTSPSK